ncbi:hypothetical protein MTP99_013314 [Tenebrio molitor]|nr:hypothetical protein MTP99_013314 [Tenebrio molitor]
MVRTRIFLAQCHHNNIRGHRDFFPKMLSPLKDNCTKTTLKYLLRFVLDKPPIMSTFTWVVLVAVLLLHLPQSRGCCTNQVSTCTQNCATQECASSCQNNCCSTSAGCCQNQVSSCCSTCTRKCATSDCFNSCQSDCCSTGGNCCGTSRKDCCDNGKEKEIVVVTGTPPRIINGADGGGTGSIAADITSTNLVNNNNVINMSINVDSNVVNNISNDCGGGGGGSTKCEEKIVKVPVKVPVMGGPPVTPIRPEISTVIPPVMPSVMPPVMPRVLSPQCCVIIVPCVTPNCNPYHHTCNGCQGNYGYLPINPCQGGCYKRATWERNRCSMGHCVSRQVDCSYCSDDFYHSYQGYSSCHGCFSGY